MAKTKISEFNANPALNTDIDSINIAEGCAPSGINDAIRELMSQLKDWQSGTSNDPMVIGSSGSLTLNQGTANGVAYLNGSKVVTSGSALTFDGTNIALKVSNGTQGYVLGVGGEAMVGSDASTYYFGTGWGGAPAVNFQFGSTGTTYQRWLAGGSEQMRLTSTGLGIGTSSPTQKLDVNGNIRTAGEVALSGSDFVYSWAGGTTGQRRSGFYLDGTNNVLRFYTNQSEVGRFDSSGNLGLGVTPSAWRSTFKAMEIGRVGNSIFGGVSGSSLECTSNVYLDTSSTYRYANNGAATDYYQQGGNHIWYNAASGTAGNAITFTQAMTLDASGNLLVGTTSTDPANNNAIVLNAPSSVIRFANTNTTGKQWTIGTSTPGIASAGDFLSVGRYSGSAWAEFTRIDSSGNLLVGTTATVNAAKSVFSFSSSNNGVYLIDSTGVSGAQFMRFDSTSNTCGSITRVGTTSAVAYNTSSDYRLKNTIAPMTGALAKVALLKPCTYKWNADGSDGEGFIAHELAEVVPQCVTGEKDAVDDEGNPKYQGIDVSFLVATLTAAIQELKAEFDAYKASHP